MARVCSLGRQEALSPAGPDLTDTAAFHGVPATVKSSCFILCLSLILSHLQVQIVYKPVDLSKVTSKCGSLGNIHHKPGSPCRRREAGEGGTGRGWRGASPEVAGKDAGDGLMRGALEVGLAGPLEGWLPCLASEPGAMLAKAKRGRRADAGPKP